MRDMSLLNDPRQFMFIFDHVCGLHVSCQISQIHDKIDAMRVLREIKLLREFDHENVSLVSHWSH